MTGEDQTIASLLNSFSPSGTALLEWLKPHIDDSMLWEIADADSGYLIEENFAVLSSIRDEQRMPSPLRWSPREALEIVRSSGPGSWPWNDTEGEWSHLIQAFSCAVLLKAANDPESFKYILAENEAIIQLIDSILRLGADAMQNALSFLCWRVLTCTPDAELVTSEFEIVNEEYPFFVMAILLLRVAAFEPGQDATEFKLLAEWIVFEEAWVRSQDCEGYGPEWLLGLTNYVQQHARWRQVISDVLLDPAKGIPEPAASALRGIAERILPRLS
jgi:hypothetical protein